MSGENNYKIGSEFSEKQFEQSDFGHIYFNTPQEHREPKTIEELAETLAHYNQKGVPVTIRNTGHSVNGQTLTDGVQVSVAELKLVDLDEDNMEVTVGTGSSWHEMIQVLLPKYSTPIFPNNPNQEIKVGGTAAVGGIGFLTTKYGGFWNLIKRLTVVTMTGEIIECSPEKNQDVFYYSLGGFGRIGVIASITIEIVPSKNLLLLLAVYHSKETFYEDYIKALGGRFFEGVLPFVAPKGKGVNMQPHILNLVKEVDSEIEAEEALSYAKELLKEDIVVSATPKHNKDNLGMSLSLGERIIPREDVIYWYPKIKNDEQFEQSHPWSDFVIDIKDFKQFIPKALSIVEKYEMAQYLAAESLFDGLYNIREFGAYTIKKKSNAYPLSLDLPQADYTIGFGVNPTVPVVALDKAIEMIKELTDLCYSFKGRRYLYGIHDLSPKQVEIHFGRDVIEKWNKLKKDLDPKNLLNIGVIEHLD